MFKNKITNNIMKAFLMMFAFSITIPNLSAQVVISGSEEIIKFSDPSKKGTIKFKWNNGDVRVFAHDKKEIRIEIPEKKRESRRESRRTRGLKRVSGGVDIEYEIEGNTISIKNYSSLLHSVDVDIYVPEDAFLSFENGQYGDIEIDGHKGEIEVYTVYGDIELKKVTGPVTAYTTYGEIKGDFVNINSTLPMSFKSQYGDIELEMPANLKASLQIRASDEVWSDFDMVLTSNTRRSSKRKEYTVNGGGVDIEIETAYGTIILRKGR